MFRQLIDWLLGRNEARRNEALQDKTEALQLNLKNGVSTPVFLTKEGQLWQAILLGRCPDCGSEGFLEGPQGGLSINICCTNMANPHWFNVTPAIGIAERIRR